MSVSSEIAPSSPAGQIFSLASGLVVSRLLYLVAEHGIAELLSNGSRTTAELAEVTGVHEPSLYRVLRSLASIGVFTEESERRFASTPLGETLESGHPSCARDAVLTRAGDRSWKAWGEVREVVATGRTGMELAFGMPLFEAASSSMFPGAGTSTCSPTSSTTGTRRAVCGSCVRAGKP